MPSTVRPGVRIEVDGKMLVAAQPSSRGASWLTLPFVIRGSGASTTGPRPHVATADRLAPSSSRVLIAPTRSSPGFLQLTLQIAGRSLAVVLDGEKNLVLSVGIECLPRPGRFRKS